VGAGLTLIRLAPTIPTVIDQPSGEINEFATDFGRMVPKDRDSAHTSDHGNGSGFVRYLEAQSPLF
jgi:hypothetical protein